MAGVKFLRNKQGSIAMSGAFAMMAILGITGAAVDYSSAVRARQRLNAMADAAAMVAVGNSSRTLSADQAREKADSAFRSALGSETQVNLANVNVAVNDTSAGRAISISYTATYHTLFMQAFGFSTLALGGTIQATGNMPVYIDFHLLLDNSPSMGLGATQTDIDNLNKVNHCAFACHIQGSKTDEYAKARKLGVTLRIDTVRVATQSLMDTAKSLQVVPNQFGMALYTFGAYALQEKLTEIFARSTNLTAAKTAAGTIDLMIQEYVGVRNYANTDFRTKFDSLNLKVPTSGDGKTPNSPYQVVIFVSDGLNNSAKVGSTCNGPTLVDFDYINWRYFTRCFEPVNTAQCDTLKARGIKIAVLHTLYLPLPYDWTYNTYVAPIATAIPKAMKACASEGYYFPVSPTGGIAEAMNALFLKTVQNVKLTH